MINSGAWRIRGSVGSLSLESLEWWDEGKGAEQLLGRGLVVWWLGSAVCGGARSDGVEGRACCCHGNMGFKWIFALRWGGVVCGVG